MPEHEPTMARAIRVGMLYRRLLVALIGITSACLVLTTLAIFTQVYRIEHVQGVTQHLVRQIDALTRANQQEQVQGRVVLKNALDYLVSVSQGQTQMLEFDLRHLLIEVDRGCLPTRGNHYCGIGES